MTILVLFSGSWETWHHVPLKRGTWVPAVTGHQTSIVLQLQLWAGVGGRVLAEQAGRNAPLPAQRP